MSLDIEALYREQHRLLRGYVAKRMDGATDDAIEDVVADVWERAIRGAPRYRDQGAPTKAWLYTIARNLLIDHYRHRSVVTIVRLGDLKPYVDHVGTSDHLARIDAQQAVSVALGTLTSLQRAVIVGRYYEGRAHKQMGHIATLNGSKKLQDRAIANLKRAVEAA